MKRLAGLAGLILTGAGFLALRGATLSTHQAAPVGSRLEVVVSARSRNAPSVHSLESMTRARVLTCQLDVGQKVVDDRIEALGDHRFRFVFSPSLDHSDQLQLRGCLNDVRADHIITKVERMRDVAADPTQRG